MNLEQMETEAWCRAEVTPIELVRHVMNGKIRWTPADTQRWFHLLNICNVAASDDIALNSLSLEEAERLFAALEPTDLDCEDPSNPIELQRIETEIRVMLALARRIGPDERISAIRIFQHLHPVQEEMQANRSVVRNITEYVGLSMADVVMQRHGIPLGEDGIRLEEEIGREQVREHLMNHVAGEILAGD